MRNFFNSLPEWAKRLIEREAIKTLLFIPGAAFFAGAVFLAIVVVRQDAWLLAYVFICGGISILIPSYDVLAVWAAACRHKTKEAMEGFKLVTWTAVFQTQFFGGVALLGTSTGELILCFGVAAFMALGGYVAYGCYQALKRYLAETAESNDD